MRPLLESRVSDGDLDDLGHMNSRVYEQRALEAHELLLQTLGLDKSALRAQGGVLAVEDLYTRFHREQFAGAGLQVHGGVAALGETSAAFFYDVRNAATAESTATVIVECALRDGASRALRALPREAAARAADHRVTIPPHGRPRSLTLDPPRLTAYAEILERLGDQPGAHIMNQRRRRAIDGSDCDPYGYLATEEDPMLAARVLAKSPPLEAGESAAVFVTGDGRRLGWALLEKRMTWIGRARAGESIESIGAEVLLGAKTRQTRRWIYNASRGGFIAVTDAFMIALDLDARRAMEIPSDIRRAFLASHAPEFA